MLDNYYVNLLTNWCAKVTELNNATIRIGEQYDPDGVPLPFILISSYVREMAEAQAPFGDGEYHLDGLVYPYKLFVTNAFETVGEAKNFAANVSASLTAELADQVESVGLLISPDGEGVKLFEFDDGELYIRGMAGQQPEGKYTGTACVHIRVLTER